MEADHAVFVYKTFRFPNIITTYVDNIGLILESLEQINQDKEAPRQYYEMTDLGKIGWILSIHVTHDCDKGTIALSQEKFIREVLERYGMLDTCPISTPALANKHLIKLSSPEINAKGYQHTLSSLMYPMLGTCPNLAYAVMALGCHAMNSSPNHQHALEHVLQYLQATINHQLILGYSTSSTPTLLSYVNADWASDVNDCKSMSGYVFTLGGSTISWSSKKQTTVALSSTEAKYIARAHAAKEAV